MPWSKEHKTKQKLIKCALDLFYKNGYEDTPIEAIVNKAGLSKGAFFHYFKAKEDLLHAIADKYTQEVTDIMAQIADESDLSAIEKFNKIITQGQRHKINHSEEYKKVGLILYDYRSMKFQYEILDRMTEKAVPPIEKIIRQGMKEGAFQVEYPAETADAFVRFLFMMREPLMKIMKGEVKVGDFADTVEKKIKFFENIMNRMLGAEPGTVKLPKINKQLIKLMKLFVK